MCILFWWSPSLNVCEVQSILTIFQVVFFEMPFRWGRILPILTVALDARTWLELSSTLVEVWRSLSSVARLSWGTNLEAPTTPGAVAARAVMCICPCLRAHNVKRSILPFSCTWKIRLHLSLTFYGVQILVNWWCHINSLSEARNGVLISPGTLRGVLWCTRNLIVLLLMAAAPTIIK